MSYATRWSAGEGAIDSLSLTGTRVRVSKRCTMDHVINPMGHQYKNFDIAPHGENLRGARGIIESGLRSGRHPKR